MSRGLIKIVKMNGIHYAMWQRPLDHLDIMVIPFEGNEYLSLESLSTNPDVYQYEVFVLKKKSLNKVLNEFILKRQLNNKLSFIDFLDAIVYSEDVNKEFDNNEYLKLVGLLSLVKESTKSDKIDKNLDTIEKFLITKNFDVDPLTELEIMLCDKYEVN